jgi:polyisoprenoid-binding protein YceI
MRTRILALAALALATPLAAQQKINVAPTSKVVVEGTSNVHAWHATSTALTTAIDVVPGKPSEIGANVRAVTVSLPVTSLQSGKGGMDKNIQKALNSDKHPTISFRMTSYDAAPQGSAYTATVRGTVNVNGVDKPVVINATVTPDGKGGVKAVGTSTMKMTDFGVKPVTAMLGAIKTGDAVTVKFELTGTAAQMVASLPAN